MPKVDHEAAFNELWKLATEGNGMPCVWPIDKEAFLARHTHRTEEDLPKSGIWWVRYRGDDIWFLAQFHGHHINMTWNENFCSVYSENHPRGWQKAGAARFSLEIGPQILPPGACHD